MQKNWNIPLIRPVAQTKSLQQNTLNLVDKQHYRPLDIRDSETASRSLPIWCFQTIYICYHIKEEACGYQTQEVHTLSRGALSASHAAFLILFYLSWFLTNVSNSYR